MIFGFDPPTTMAQTPARPMYGQDGAEFVMNTVGASSISTPVDLASNTRPVSRLFSKFGTYMLPLAIAAAFATPAVGAIRRRTGARFGYAQTGIPDFLWAGDSWCYTEETAEHSHVLLLNDLLSLRTAEGLVLDLSE
jgi:hypothetical protein